MPKTSRIPGFYLLSVKERIQKLRENTDLDERQLALLEKLGGFGVEQADKMIENVIGAYALPIGLATNFVIDGREVLVPMAVEEASVIAAASAGAKVSRAGGGFVTSSTERRMIGQIQIVDCEDFARSQALLLERRAEIMARADALMPRMVERGGGMRAVEVRELDPGTSGYPRMLAVHLVVDTQDAMGANAINTLAEAIAPLIEEISGGRAHLRILSNFTDQCLCRSEMRVPPSALTAGECSGEEEIERIVEAQAFAALDPYRAVTHNKGVMNGVDAVVIATGNDWRAIEAAAHAYAARKGRYGPMTEWRKDESGNLIGVLELPMPVGIVGGSSRLHPMAEIARSLLGVESARELGEIIVSVGLAQNFSALRALATEGIQRGHMALHARAVAATAGARGEEVDRIARELVRLNDVKVERAAALLARGRAS